MPAQSEARLVYVIPQAAMAAAQDEDIDLFKLWHILWNSRWLIVAVTAAFALGAVLYALLLPPWYRASVLLAPAKEKPAVSLTGQLGGLASLAGISTGGTGSVEAVAVLKSRDFARAFIEDQKLLPVLFAEDWDATASRWTVADPPDHREAVELFDKSIRKVEEDRRTGLVTLSVEWKDPEFAAAWANLLSVRLNDHMRERALTEAELNVKFLRHELESTPIVGLQQSISRLLENEMEKVMLARSNAEFAFRIIDRAEVPRLKSKPKRTLMVVVATLLGGMFAVMVVLVGDAVRKRAVVTAPAKGTSSVRTG